MGTELTILALYGLLLGLTVGLQVLLAIPNMGFLYLLGPRDAAKMPDGLAGRCSRALDNSVTAMVLFAPAILILSAKDAFSATTLLCAQIFLIARIAYLPVYLMGIPWLRTLVWGAAFGANLILYFIAMSA